MDISRIKSSSSTWLARQRHRKAIGRPLWLGGRGQESRLLSILTKRARRRLADEIGGVALSV